MYRACGEGSVKVGGYRRAIEGGGRLAFGARLSIPGKELRILKIRPENLETPGFLSLSMDSGSGPE